MVVTYKTPRKDLDLSPQDQLPAKKERKNPNWPKLLPRMQWAIQQTTDLHLNRGHRLRAMKTTPKAVCPPGRRYFG